MINESVKVDESVLEYVNSLTLLCVEDNSTTQLIYESIFEDTIKEVVYCSDGHEGYEAYLDNKIDIIVTDYLMPKLNGLEMIEKIRELNSTIPILLVSSIEDITVIKTAIELNITNFIEKPLKASEIMNAITNASKILIADNYLKAQRDKKIQELEEKDKYSSAQEDLAFEKELNILKNDFYYQMVDIQCVALIDFMYKPLDVLSGDAYTARRIDETRMFYLVVDGMGKGLSASLSAMIITSFINYIIDVSEFDFNRVIYDSIEYIKPILLEEEALSIDYILIDCNTNNMSYAKFSMPASLTQSNKNEIIPIKSNNPPISKYMNTFNISTFDIKDTVKFLFYSDGMVESPTRFNNTLYSDHIQKDFLDSFTKEDLREKILWKLESQEDDITFIFVHKLSNILKDKDNMSFKKYFLSSLDEVENANEWYSTIWNNFTDNTNKIYTAGVVFSELFMNAFEHGSLGLSYKEKHILLEDDIYFETLESSSKECTKKISVEINQVEYFSNKYIITRIIDEGDGFDTQILSSIFRNKEKFNGRGVFVSRRSSDGIYYNQKGNSVLFLHKI